MTGRARFLVAALAMLASLLPTATTTIATALAQENVVVRVRGEDRVATAVAAARVGWTSAPHVLVATSANYPDAIAAAAYASSLDAPVLLTPPDEVPEVLRQGLADLDVRRVTILGGRKAVSEEVEARLRGLGLEVSRIAGTSRFATAAELAEQVGARGTVEVVALALGDRGDGRDAWPDALAAASLAGLQQPIPTLLTRRDALPVETRDALAQLRPSKVLVLGGGSAVSDAVLDELKRLGHATERLDGPNRFATSVAVATEAMSGTNEDHGELPARRFVAVSGEGFADALGAGALAARLQAPLLLVPSGRLADSVDAFVRTDATDFGQAVVVGGGKAVSDFVTREIAAAINGEPRPAPQPTCDLEYSSPDCRYTYRHKVSTWEALADCESHGNWGTNSGNGYYGGLQFHIDTWRGVGGQGYPHENSKWEQIHRGDILQERSGWGQWPHCSRELGLR